MTANYTHEVNRAIAMCQVAGVGPVAEYYRGYRIGISASESSSATDEATHAGLLKTAEISPRDLRTHAVRANAGRVARAWGYVDGLNWREPGVRPGLLRLAILRSGLTSGAFAATLARDSRTIRDWQNPGQRIPEAALAAIERNLVDAAGGSE